MKRWAVVLLCGVTACATVPFDRYMSQQRWSDAAAAFDRDSTLLDDEHALFEAGMLFSSPVRGAYEPRKAQSLLRRFIAEFPSAGRRVEAADRLALVDSVLTSQARVRAVSERIAALEAEASRLRSTRDSAVVAKGAADATTARLQSDLRDRDEQLRQLRAELARLKEIDLRQRRPPFR